MQEQPYLELSKVLVNHADGSTCSIDATVKAIIENSGLETFSLICVNLCQVMKLPVANILQTFCIC